MLGFGSFAELPFAASSESDGAVTINVVGNSLNITIGSVGIIATAVIEDPDPNQIVLGTGTLSLTGDANFTVTGNATALGIGNFVVTAAATANVTGNTLTLATGNVTVTGTALINPDGSPLSLGTVEPGIITWNDIIPGATMVWTPIKPY